MADLGKLWFELGVRENVTGELDRIKEQMLKIQVAAYLTAQALEDMNDKNSKATKAATTNAQKQEIAMNKVGTAISNISRDMTNLRNLMDSNKFGVDTTEIERSYRRLAELQREYLNALAEGNISTSALQALNARFAEARAEASFATQRFTIETRNASKAEKEEAKSIKDTDQALKEQQNILNQNARTISDYANTFEKLRSKMQDTSRYASELKNQMSSLFSLYAAERLVKNMITIGGEFEKQHIALKSMLGDAQQANDIFAQIKSLAPISPFTFRDLSTYTKQLAAFGIEYKDLYDTTKRLADISAGLGVDMSRLILAFGQVRSASVLRGQELRQFTEAGIPIVDALAKKLTEMNGKLVKTSEVFDYISKRQVPFEMVKDILWDLTDAGGRFSDMQLTLSETLAGRWSNLQDAWEIMLSEMANSETIIGKTLKSSVELVTNAVNNLNTIAPALMAGAFSSVVVASARRLSNVLVMQTGQLKEQVLQSKRLIANNIQLNVVEGKRTQLQRDIIATKSKVTAQDVAMLFTEGKINALQAQQLIKANGITVAEMERLVAEKAITNEQYKQIANATRSAVIANGILSTMKAIAVTAAVFAATAAAMYFWNKWEKGASQAQDAVDSAAQRFEGLNEVLRSMGNDTPSKLEDINMKINEMENALKGIDPYLEKIKEKYDPSDAKGYYEALRKELEMTTNAYKKAMESKDLYEDVDRWATLGDKFQDWNDSITDASNIIAKSGKDSLVRTRERIRELAQTNERYKWALYDENGKERSVVETLRNLLKGDRSGSEYWKLSNDLGGTISNKVLTQFRGKLDSEEKSLTSLRGRLKEVFADIRNDILATGNGIEEGTEEYSVMFMQMLSSIITSTGQSVDKVQEAWKDMLPQFGVNEFRAVIPPLMPGEVMTTNEDNNTRKTSTDKVLKAWKEEFSELKKFYSQYKKWAKDIGKDAALKNLRESGIFSAMFDKAGKPIFNIDDWRDALQQFRKTLKGGTLDRDKFIVDVDLEVNDFDYDKNHEALEDSAKRISEYLSDELAKYNLFEKLFEKTGDKSFAKNAFSNGRMWTDATRGMAEKLAEMLKTEVNNIDFDADSISMEKALEGTQGAFEIWKKIVDLTKDEYNKSLENAADATEKLMNYEERIAKLQAQRAELIRKGASNAEVIAVDKEIMKQQTEQFENSTDYLRFYSAILSMTTDEAERIGTSIRENLVKQLADGNINADKYLKSMRNITQQIDKARGGLLGNSDFATFVNGGQKGLVDKRWEEMASAAIKVQNAEKDLMKAQEKGSEAEILSAKVKLNIAKQELNAASKALGITESQYDQLKSISMISDAIMGALSGMQAVAKSVSDMFDALGNENAANTWSDIADGIGIVTDTLKPLDGILKNFMSGNISGMVSNALLAPVNLITAPITGIAKLHDKKLNRSIEASVQEVNKLKTAYDNLEASISNRLGGIYGGREYTEMFSNLQKQRAELQKQMQLEDEKKKTDNQKMADYEQSIREMDQQIKDFAKDMADSLYGINVKSWAKELTDAVVGAWIKGEDAAEAFHDKVKDIVTDLTKNILTQKIMETALQPVLDEIVAEMTLKKGQLDEQSIKRFADSLAESGEGAVSTITAFLEAMKANGMDLTESSSASSGGLSKGIQGMTEETSNLLASYINAVRADVSVIRMVLETAYGTGEGSMIAQAQLQQLEMISSNTARNADAAERIESLFNAITIGAKKIYIN